jgi:spermidine synthase
VRIAILSGILFLSGISALIFETLWLRLSGLAFGNSVWSAALILSSFMAGLALGSAIASRYQLRRVRALRLYAGLEVVIAFLGCTIVFGIPMLGEWMRPLFQTLWNHDIAMNALRLFFSFLILLIPTTAMGLSLPVVLEDPLLQRHHFGRAISLLYGCNTLGAVAGALIGEAYLVGAFGLWGTALAAGLLNCAAAFLALMLARTDEGTAIATIPAAKPELQSETNQLPRWRLLAISFGSGFVLLCLEVVWFRFLRLFVASTSTAFAVMLAVVLAGIGLGAVVSSAIRRRDQGSERLPMLLAISAVATLACYVLFPIRSVGGSDFYLDTWQEIGALSIALMFPVSFLSGMLFPSVVARIQAELPSRMNSTGIATLFNTTGAAVGPILASFVLLPAIGFQWSLVLCAGIYLLLSLLAIGRATWSARNPGALALLVVCVASTLALVFFSRQRDEEHFAHARTPFEADGSRLIKKVEGISDTLQLLRRDALAEPYYYRLLTNAFTMSDTRYQNQRYMRTFAYLPLTLRPEARDALLICYGCGVTADALVHERGLQRVDIVDISKEVFALAENYTGFLYSNPLRDSRVTKFVQDGRFFLQASPRQYDVITGEPPPPKIAGTVNLYTEEFFRLMNSRLKEGGIASFWLPINQLKVEEAWAILRGFHNAFPNASVWANSDFEWIMLGIKGTGRKLGEDESRRLWSDANTRSDLERIGLEVPEQLPALFVMDAGEIERVTRETAPLTDFYPKRLSDRPADPEATRRLATDYLDASAALRRFRASPFIAAIWPELSPEKVAPFFIVRETRYLSEIKGSNKLAELDFYLRKFSLRAPVLEVLHEDPFQVLIAERVAQTSPTLPAEALPDLAAGALARRDFNGAIEFLESERAQGTARSNDLLLLTYVYCLNGNVEKAETVAAEIGPGEKDWLVKWLWGKLQAEFGFRPPG